MKQILNMIKLYLYTGLPFLTDGAMLLLMMFLLILGILLAPIEIFAAPLLVAVILTAFIPTVEEQSGYSKLYGILPVERKNRVRGQFFYSLMVFFLCETGSMVLTLLSFAMKLGRLLPFKDPFRRMIENEYTDTGNLVLAFCLLTAAFVLLELYQVLLVMVSGVFGREAKTKVYAGLIITPLALGGLFMFLNERDVLPVIDLSSLRPPETFTAGVILFILTANAAMFGLTALFAELTAAKLEKNEL